MNTANLNKDIDKQTEANILRFIKSEDFSFETIHKIAITSNQIQANNHSNSNSYNLDVKPVIENGKIKDKSQEAEDVFKIAEKAEKLLREILDSNKNNNNKNGQITQTSSIAATTPTTPITRFPLSNENIIDINQRQQVLQHPQYSTISNQNVYQYQVQQQQQYPLPVAVQNPYQVHIQQPPQIHQAYIQQSYQYPQQYSQPPHVLQHTTTAPSINIQYNHHQRPPQQYFIPPNRLQTQPCSMNTPIGTTTTQMPLSQMNYQQYQQSYRPYYQQPHVFYQNNSYNMIPNMQRPPPTLQQQQQQPQHIHIPSLHHQYQQQQQQRFPLKRKFNEMQHYNEVNTNTNNIVTNQIQNSTQNKSNHGQTEDDDLNIIRERELKDLKCKSVVEKMSVFIKNYKQFKDLYQQRMQTIECSDTLKMQFHSLIKYLNEYEIILNELDLIISEHERDFCKNNHRKTKKFFNKTKAFIRYELNKRLQSNIFEYRRQINSQDRFAGMYDLLEMNNYLIGLLPDIGVSIRRYINKCEKARNQVDDDYDDDELNPYLSENSNASFSGNANLNDNQNDNEDDTQNGNAEKENKDVNNATNNTNDTSITINTTASTITNGHKEPPRSYESFSKGVDSLNRYLLKRVEDEESIDELVKERIIKWINKRQSKYILIFGEVDKLLNQHKDGECYSKFHSYLLFNLGKLVTVCESYHQKLKELLYSTTIKRKKKRKKVKLLPESMSDVFNEIIELKRALEHTKAIIKKCNDFKHFNKA